MAKVSFYSFSFCTVRYFSAEYYRKDKQVKIINQANYDTDVVANSGDFYGRAILEFATRWADAMEAALARGEKIEDCYMRLSHQPSVDSGGITEFMFCCAVRYLANCWEHGEALRIAHNAHYNIPATEPGVVNSAILHISLPD